MYDLPVSLVISGRNGDVEINKQFINMSSDQ